MDFLSLGLAVLKLANLLLGYVKDSQLINVGQDKEIARTAVAILKRTQAAKEIDDEVAKLSDADVLTSLAKRGELRD